MRESVGYLIDAKTVICDQCALSISLDTEPQPCKLWSGNILPYFQDCHHCGKTLVEGQFFRHESEEPLVLFPMIRECRMCRGNGPSDQCIDVGCSRIYKLMFEDVEAGRSARRDFSINLLKMMREDKVANMKYALNRLANLHKYTKA